MDRSIADTLEETLDGSVRIQLERFGLCQYDLGERRLTHIIPPAYFEHHELVELCRDGVIPSEALMEQVRAFNSGGSRKVRMLGEQGPDGKKYNPERRDGVLVPYHTHWTDDGDFFSSAEDSNWSFVQNEMFIDLVVSQNARQRNVAPPVCITYNPEYFPFSEQAVPYLSKSPGDLAKLDEEKGWKLNTHAILLGRQIMRYRHLSMDCLIDG